MLGPITFENYGAMNQSHNRTVIFDGSYYRVFYKHPIFGGNYYDIAYATLDRFGRLVRTDRIGFTENDIIYGYDVYSLPGSTEILLGYARAGQIQARTGTISGDSISWSAPTSATGKTNPRTAIVMKTTDGYFWFEEYYPHQSNKGATLATIFGSACAEFATSYEVTAQYARLPDNYLLLVCSDYNDTQISWYRHKQNACGGQNNLAAKTANLHLMGKLGLTEDSAGNAHCIYPDTAGNLQYKKYTYSTNSFGAAVQLDTAFLNAIIAVDANDCIYVFWSKSSDANIYCKTSVDGGANFSAVFTAVSESLGNIGAMGCEHRSPRAGTIGVIWTVSGTNTLRFMTLPNVDEDFLAEKIDFKG